MHHKPIKRRKLIRRKYIPSAFRSLGHSPPFHKHLKLVLSCLLQVKTKTKTKRLLPVIGLIFHNRLYIDYQSGIHTHTHIYGHACTITVHTNTHHVCYNRLLLQARSIYVRKYWKCKLLTGLLINSNLIFHINSIITYLNI